MAEVNNNKHGKKSTSTNVSLSVSLATKKKMLTPKKCCIKLIDITKTENFENLLKDNNENRSRKRKRCPPKKFLEEEYISQSKVKVQEKLNTSKQNRTRKQKNTTSRQNNSNSKKTPVSSRWPSVSETSTRSYRRNKHAQLGNTDEDSKMEVIIERIDMNVVNVGKILLTRRSQDVKVTSPIRVSTETMHRDFCIQQNKRQHSPDSPDIHNKRQKLNSKQRLLYTENDSDIKNEQDSLISSFKCEQDLSLRSSLGGMSKHGSHLQDSKICCGLKVIIKRLDLTLLNDTQTCNVKNVHLAKRSFRTNVNRKRVHKRATRAIRIGSPKKTYGSQGNVIKWEKLNSKPGTRNRRQVKQQEKGSFEVKRNGKVLPKKLKLTKPNVTIKLKSKGTKGHKASQKKTVKKTASLSKRIRPRVSISKFRPYICSICSVKFELQMDGKVHELTHSNKIPVLMLNRCVLSPENSNSLTTDLPDIFDKDTRTSHSEHESNDRSQLETSIEKNNEIIVKEQIVTIQNDSEVHESSNDRESDVSQLDTTNIKEENLANETHNDRESTQTEILILQTAEIESEKAETKENGNRGEVTLRNRSGSDASTVLYVSNLDETSHLNGSQENVNEIEERNPIDDLDNKNEDGKSTVNTSVVEDGGKMSVHRDESKQQENSNSVHLSGSQENINEIEERNPQENINEIEERNPQENVNEIEERNPVDDLDNKNEDGTSTVNSSVVEDGGKISVHRDESKQQESSTSVHLSGSQENINEIEERNPVDDLNNKNEDGKSTVNTSVVEDGGKMSVHRDESQQESSSSVHLSGSQENINEIEERNPQENIHEIEERNPVDDLDNKNEDGKSTVNTSVVEDGGKMSVHRDESKHESSTSVHLSGSQENINEIEDRNPVDDLDNKNEDGKSAVNTSVVEDGGKMSVHRDESKQHESSTSVHLSGSQENINETEERNPVDDLNNKNEDGKSTVNTSVVESDSKMPVHKDESKQHEELKNVMVENDKKSATDNDVIKVQTLNQEYTVNKGIKAVQEKIVERNITKNTYDQDKHIADQKSFLNADEENKNVLDQSQVKSISEEGTADITLDQRYLIECEDNDVTYNKDQRTKEYSESSDQRNVSQPVTDKHNSECESSKLEAQEKETVGKNGDHNTVDNDEKLPVEHKIVDSVAIEREVPIATELRVNINEEIESDNNLINKTVPESAVNEHNTCASSSEIAEALENVERRENVEVENVERKDFENSKCENQS